MLTPDKVLAHYYLDTRCKLIEIAAMLDRFDRAKSGLGVNGQRGPADERITKIQRALALLAQPDHPDSNRSEQLLLMFSDLD